MAYEERREVEVESCTSFGDMKIVTDQKSFKHRDFQMVHGCHREEIPDHRNPDMLEITDSW